MARSGPISLSLPSFGGATRQLILANLAVFFSVALLGWLAPGPINAAMAHLALVPAELVRGQVWQLLTFSFLPMGLLGMVFGMLTLWFIGSFLEDIKGARWLLELYLVAAAGGALLAAAITFTGVLKLDPRMVALGASTPLMALLVAFGVIVGDQEIRLMFLIGIKAKYLAILYVLITMAVVLLKGGNERFGALTDLCAAAAAYLLVKYAPRRGLAFGASERYFGVRNGFYKWKRRRAARKFEVYMGKQGRKVNFDKDGRYVDPEEARRTGHNPRDPDDKRWMN